MARPYELRQRAESQARTRRRIVEAAMELHTSCGPARTTIKAVAERAGVQRHTVYRHFPTEDELFGACSAAWEQRHPFPSPEAWPAIADPEERLRRALTEIYEYYATVAPDLAMFLRDAELVPALQRALAEDAALRERLRSLLARGWGARGARRRMLLAAIGHALDFAAWSSLARDQGLGTGECTELMTAMVAGSARSQIQPRRRKTA